ncbi:hypothetical protein VSH64_10735 [Amycolatopsis rhabdoformis]|uniref:MarR family transcriptional regulator n=1 Tax=Amycolatopsis rhabdoformis TaxID=1448059 RepID=A0ABZ1IDN5_9PSEU|nr:hypothetical protein [Amycolatopsis rhabdoformis]WSE32581.1 hypothetical protein VSH64_10735 [Amycolatopsis rhabdoformis]
MTDLRLLRTVALKGRVDIDQVVTTLGADAGTVGGLVDDAVSAGHLVRTPQDLLRTTKEGREALAAALADERARLDADAIRALYEEFSVVNAEAKAIFTAWQLNPDGTPNDHTDPGYDADVLGRIAAEHEKVVPILTQVAGLVPRAGRYLDRLTAAKARFESGDHTFVTKPIIDSYHTVWFELHEDLIGWAGLTRAAEAAAGRAT